MRSLFTFALLTFLAAGPATADELCRAYAGLPTGDDSKAGMVRVDGGTFVMGDDTERPEERTAHDVTVSPFWIDRHEVTNAQFAAFVEATGYVTVAEKGLDPDLYPDLPPELLAPGGMVFKMPEVGQSQGQRRAMVGLCARCRLAPSGRARKLDRGVGKPSGGADRARRRARLCALARP